MSERTDANEIRRLKDMYAPPMRRCRGGRIVHAQYVCQWCDSDSPDTECYKPHKEYKAMWEESDDE